MLGISRQKPVGEALLRFESKLGRRLWVYLGSLKMDIYIYIDFNLFPSWAIWVSEGPDDLQVLEELAQTPGIRAGR